MSQRHSQRRGDIDSIRGHEGSAGRAYFSILQFLLREEVPSELRFSGRNRRPPRDRVNAILSFGYSTRISGRHAGHSFSRARSFHRIFHTPRSSAYPLVMDVMELFRITLWDMVR